jgi:membrane protein YdbS with pleckstrin-like domain
MTSGAIRPDQKLLLKFYLILAIVVALCDLPLVLLVLIPGWGLTYLAIYLLVNALWLVPTVALLPPYFRSIEYELGEEEIVVRRGIITKSETTVPYRTVTNIATKRGPLDRLLSLGSLQIHTAGFSQNASPEATLSGLADYAEAHSQIFAALRRYRARTGATVGAEESTLGEGAAPIAAEVAALLRELLDEVRVVRRALDERRG